MGTFLDTLFTLFDAYAARQIALHVASVNAFTEQRGEQRLQPHVELRFVERFAS